MRIIDTNIKTWAKGYANEYDELNLIIPNFKDDLIFEAKTVSHSIHDYAVAYFGQNDMGLCRGYLHTPANQNGFGGATFDLPMKDHVQSIKGPWTSRPSIYHEYGFPVHHEVTINGSLGGYALLIPQYFEVLAQFTISYDLMEVTSFGGLTHKLVAK